MDGKAVNLYRPFGLRTEERRKRTARGKENKFHPCAMHASDTVRGTVYAHIMTAYVIHVPTALTGSDTVYAYAVDCMHDPCTHGAGLQR